MNRNKFTAVLIVIITAAAVTGFIIIAVNKVKTGGTADTIKTFRIFHVMSYHSPWQWTEDQIKGFAAGIAPLTIEIKEFQMDTKKTARKRR